MLDEGENGDARYVVPGWIGFGDVGNHDGLGSNGIVSGMGPSGPGVVLLNIYWLGEGDENGESS